MSRWSPDKRPSRDRRSGDDDPLADFVRGATVGAFVGAAIAGSAAWHRVRKRVAAGRAGSAAQPADTAAVAETSAVPGPPAHGHVEVRGR